MISLCDAITHLQAGEHAAHDAVVAALVPKQPRAHAAQALQALDGLLVTQALQVQRRQLPRRRRGVPRPQLARRVAHLASQPKARERSGGDPRRVSEAEVDSSWLP